MSNFFLQNQFLIAMPSLADPNFFQSVTYICEHTEEGAMGIVINKPLNLHLKEVLAHMDIDVVNADSENTPVYFGGPVQPERGFIVHNVSRQWESTLAITDDLAVTTSKDVLEDIAVGNGPEKMLIALGYAGWGPGQLEQEISENAWLSGPASESILFDIDSEKRWEEAAKLLGVDLNLISSDIGHA